MTPLLAALYGLRTRLLSLVLLALIPPLLLSLDTGLERRRAEGRHAQETAERFAALASTEMEGLVDGTRNLLAGLSRVPAVRALSADCSDLLAEVHRQSPAYTVMGAARPDGEYVCSSLPISGSVNLADRRHFRLAVDGRGFSVGDFVVGRVSGKASVNLALAMLDEAGAVQGVVIAGVDLEALARLAGRAQLPDGSDVIVLDRQGVVLTSYPPAPGRIGSALADSDLFRAIVAQAGAGTVETTGPDGTARLYAFAPLISHEPRDLSTAPDDADGTTSGPVVVVGIPTAVAYARADAALARTLGGLGIVSVLALLAAWLGGEAFILRRVRAILRATRRLTAGDLQARVGPTRAAGELDELAQAFDDMAAALERRDGERQQFERSLEESRSRLERESERLLALHRVSARLAGEVGAVDVVLDEILRSAVMLIGDCDGATLHLWEEETGRLRRAHAWGVAASYPSQDAQPGVGLVGRVFASGEPLIVDDYQDWGGAMPSARAGQVRATFGVPLRHAGRRIGVIMIGSHHAGRPPFTTDDVRLVGLFADQAATAIETARLYDDVAVQLRRLRTLTRLNRVIFSTLDRAAVLTEIARAAAALTDAPFAAFWVLDPAEGVLRTSAFSDEQIGRALRSRRLTLHDAGLDGPDSAPGTHVQVRGVGGDPRIVTPSWWRTHGLNASYGVPLADDDGTLQGMLALYGRGAFHFTPEDRDLLDSFVALAAVAIRNAALYQGEAEARQQAELANQSKNAFLSRMSHELRTPLNAILGFAQLLEMSGRLEGRDRAAIDQVLRAGQHLVGLIDDVLDISRIEAGRLSLDLAPTPLAEVVREVADLVAPLARERAVTVDLSALGGSALGGSALGGSALGGSALGVGPAGAIDGRSGSVVVADRQRLRQVLLNLLSNAVKYNRPGGRVAVTCERPDEGRVRLCVTDTGLGIEPDQMARLFEPFDRLGAERSGVEGVGLGLAISKTLAEAMGGSLTASSTAGVGSTFWLDLVAEPAERLAEEAAPGVPHERAASAETATDAVQACEGRPRAPGTLDLPAASRCILHVEDNGQVAKLVEWSLAWRPHLTLLSAATAGDGLLLAQTRQPSLILADLHLPDMPGDELLARLRGDERTADIPVVVLSGDASPDQAERLSAAGVRAFLAKPFDVRTLLGLVDEILAECF